eukprot:6085930-Pleurochrysis_carterae.AAC.1
MRTKKRREGAEGGKAGSGSEQRGKVATRSGYGVQNDSEVPTSGCARSAPRRDRVDRMKRESSAMQTFLV